MTISFSDEARRLIALAEDVTEVTVRDCLIDDERNRVAFLVKAGEIGKAIGKDGVTVRRLEKRLGRDVSLIEDAATPEAFVANALAPAAVHDVTIDETDEGTIAFAEVDDRDTGIAIGKDGQNIDLACQLAARHFDIDDVQLA